MARGVGKPKERQAGYDPGADEQERQARDRRSEMKDMTLFEMKHPDDGKRHEDRRLEE